MKHTDTAGGAGNARKTPDDDREVIDVETADAEAMMARLDEEIDAHNDDAGQPTADEQEAAGDDDDGGESDSPGAGDDDDDAAASGADDDQGDADKGKAKDTDKDDKDTDKDAKGDDDEGDEALPDGADRWHPASRRHIDKVLGEKKKIQARYRELEHQLESERKALDDLGALAQSVQLQPQELPNFVAWAGKALLEGDQQALAQVAERMSTLGFQSAGSAGGYSEEDLQRAIRTAAESAAEDFDPDAAYEKGLAAVRARAKKDDAGGAGDQQQSQQQQAAPRGGDQQQQQGQSVPNDVQQSVLAMVAEVHKRHGAEDGKRIEQAMATAIKQGDVPRDPRDWPLALKHIRDAEASRIAAARAAQGSKRPPPPSTTTQRTHKAKAGDPFAKLDSEIGV